VPEIEPFSNEKAQNCTITRKKLLPDRTEEQVWHTTRELRWCVCATAEDRESYQATVDRREEEENQIRDGASLTEDKEREATAPVYIYFHFHLLPSE
jgi:hypothetical protein